MYSLLFCLFVLVPFVLSSDDSESIERQTQKDCRGVAGGYAQTDACGVCDGDNSTCADCAGIPHGSTVKDACGVCGGNGQTCCPDYLGFSNRYWDWLLLTEAVKDLQKKIEDEIKMLQCETKNLPSYPLTTCGGSTEIPVGEIVGVKRDFLKNCAAPFTSQVANWTLSLTSNH
eukprot:TRINITY_DN466_c1_g1_i2.p1 TRINITY_DN466_c1_g1~~TRINITY_DN466_c1_g1_i2.p1  ORF type:complete len:173 (+),score=37.45 TRINITY_DN466_c1_g1_i2:119-637(+)